MSILSFFIGQGGVQLGSAVWELFCLEQGVFVDGSYCIESDFCSPETFFSISKSGRCTAKSVFIDLEPTVVDGIRTHQYRQLFHPETILSGNEDASNNFARGYVTTGKEIFPDVEDIIQFYFEQQHAITGFFIYHSMGGGTGSGVTSLLMEYLHEEYPKISQIQFAIYPSPKLSPSVVEPYNTVLMSSHVSKYGNCTFLMDNEALYGISNQIGKLFSPTYIDINRIIAQACSSVAAPLVCKGENTLHLSDFETNLVPFPRLHYPLICYAPFRSNDSEDNYSSSVPIITSQLFSPYNRMVMCHPEQGKYMACCLLYRGRVNYKEAVETVQKIKIENMKFVDWCPTGFKINLNYEPPLSVPGSGIGSVNCAVCMAANTTAIAEAWVRINFKFDLMYAKRAYVHWYLGEGMEDDEFKIARLEMEELEKEYVEYGKDSASVENGDKTSTEKGDISTTTSVSTKRNF